MCGCVHVWVRAPKNEGSEGASRGEERGTERRCVPSVGSHSLHPPRVSRPLSSSSSKTTMSELPVQRISAAGAAAEARLAAAAEAEARLAAAAAAAEAEAEAEGAAGRE